MAIQLQMLRSGSSGNCAILTAGSARILIDAGIGPRTLSRELSGMGVSLPEITAAIFTHSHGDHLRANTLSALAREGIPVYMNEGTYRGARRREGPGELDRIPVGAIRYFDAGVPFTVAGAQIEAFGIDHGAPGPENHAGDPVGFIISDGRDTFGYCTDIGRVTESVLAQLKRADLLVLECNHDVEMARLSARPWPVKQWILSDFGHLNNQQCADALAQAFAGREGVGVMLAHLSEQCNTVGLARATVREALEGICDAAIGVADRHRASTPWVLDGGRARPLE